MAVKQKWMYYHLSANRNRYHFEDWNVGKSLRICLNITLAIPSNLQKVNFDSRKRSDLSVSEFGGKTWCLLPPLFLLMEDVYYIIILNWSWIMEYDRAFLIDKSPQHWSVTFQLNPALRLLELFFAEKKWPKTFHLFGVIIGRSSEKNTKLGLTVFFGTPLNTYA